jgi:hypothetical protein
MAWTEGKDGKWRNQSGDIRCPHGRQRHGCTECGGASICEHGRRRSHCKDCGGTYVCEHGRRRNQCSICLPFSVVATYKRSAKKRGYAWELTDNQAAWLMEQPCAYCGQELAGGIDRAKNEYGYTHLNSVPCCKDCNYSKRVNTVKAFIVAVNQIARYCPDYPKFKRRWESIRKKLTKLGEKQCLCSSTSVPSATPHKKDSRRSQSPSTRSGARVEDNLKLPPAHLLGSGLEGMARPVA